MICASCLHEFEPGTSWQSTCCDCWGRSGPTIREVRAAILAGLRDEWVLASDMVKRSGMSGFVWPQLVLLAFEGLVDVAQWDPNGRVFRRPGWNRRSNMPSPYDGQAWVRRRVAA